MAATYSYNQMILLKDISLVWKEWRVNVLISINRIIVTAEKKCSNQVSVVIADLHIHCAKTL